MKTKISASVLTVLLVFCGVVDAKPPNRVIQFDLHETLGLPLSPKDFLVTMGLFINQRDGDDIGWEVRVVTVRQLDGSGNVQNTWSKTHPTVDTADGLWWIEHADADNPVNSEFLIPPLIFGTATQADSTEPALDFEFEGALYVAPPSGAPFPNTALLMTLLQEEDKPEPIKEEDEPVEMPNIPSEPFPS